MNHDQDSTSEGLPLLCTPHGSRHAARQCLLGIAGLACITIAAGLFHPRNLAPQPGIGPGTISLLYLIVVVFVSLTAGFVSSMVVSLLAVVCLHSFFLPLSASWEIKNPLDLAATIAFLITAWAISGMVTRVYQLTDSKLIESRRAERQLRVSETRLKTTQRIAKLGGWELDVETRKIVSWSDQLYEIFGMRKDDFTCTYETVLHRVHPLDREAVEAAKDATMAGRARLNIEYRIMLPDGTVKYIHELGDVVRDAQGTPRRLSGTALDITERKRADEALRQANASLERRVRERTEELAIAKERAEVADRTKSAFLAMMSHELRTPMNSIIGFTGILLKELAGPLNQEQAKQLGMVRESARHLLELINDILDISKIEAGELEIRVEAFDLRALVERAMETVQPSAARKSLTLRLEAPPFPNRVISDPRRVEQVLLNLLDNAIKFTEQGEVTVSVEIVPAVALCTMPPGPGVRFRVTDTGIGIRSEDLPTLFQPFRQVEAGLTRHQQGTGLGLVICRRLAELLGGEVHAESRFGSGSVFTFVFPLHQENPHP